MSPAQSPAADQINPFPRQTSGIEKVHEWTFQQGPAGWKALHHCRLAARGGRLTITSTGEDPYVFSPVRASGEAILVKLRAKCRIDGMGQLFWTTRARPNTNERNSQRFALKNDGKWHDYEVPLRPRGPITGLRFDPGSGPGTVEIERIELHRSNLHPLEIVRLVADGPRIHLRVRNHSKRPIDFRVGGKQYQAPAGRTVEAALIRKPAAPFETVAVTVRSDGLSDLTRTVHLYDVSAKAKWLVRTSGKLTVRVAPDGSGALLLREGKTVAAIAPLVSRNGEAQVLKLTETDRGVRLAGKGVTALLTLKADELTVSIQSESACEGPRLRALGPLEQGLFAGLEYLGKGERSSSKLDIETPEHVRFAPDRLKVTMPLMACVTDRATVAMTWQDMSLQPVYASPNFFDGTGDHLMALRLRSGQALRLSGGRIDATVRIGAAEPIEEAVLWATKKHGLPPLPKAPRTRQKQWALCLASLDGPIRGKGGWGHCAEPRWGRAPYADQASTIWRLTGKAPELPRLQPGGAHVRNDAVYFITGRAEEWLKTRRAEVTRAISSQKPDGSYRYKGRYARGHFEDTASGHCARPALNLLNFAWQTGDEKALAAGLKTLEYMKRFRTPRGAQTWELALHTPDILASAYLVGAYVRGYELTGKAEYLAQARRWALSGVPFVYLWSRHPVMAYATVPVYGATNWRAPNWMGLPVQWCGGVYAYWLTQLAPHEKTLDWNRLAKGILLAGEQMQYPDGPKIGCLPDVFDLPSQRRAGPSINPCAMVSLRLAVEGKLDSLAVAAAGGHRVCAPFPVTIRGGKAHIRGKAGETYQVILDGANVVTVQSKGTDAIDLPAGGARE